MVYVPICDTVENKLQVMTALTHKYALDLAKMSKSNTLTEIFLQVPIAQRCPVAHHRRHVSANLHWFIKFFQTCLSNCCVSVAGADMYAVAADSWQSEGEGAVVIVPPQENALATLKKFYCIPKTETRSGTDFGAQGRRSD